MKQISIYSGSSAWENSFFVSTNSVHLNAFPRIVDTIQTTKVNGVDLINHNINSFINQNCVMRVDWFKDHYVHFYFVPGLHCYSVPQFYMLIREDVLKVSFHAGKLP